MTGYTKLFNSIIASTLWRDTKDVKILFVTMMAMADKNGLVEASVPGLADIARLTIGETEAALASLMSPDPYSRTKDHEGRRIAVVDGGWRLLNHGKYRAKMGADERREYLTEKKRESRDRLRSAPLFEERETPQETPEEKQEVVTVQEDAPNVSCETMEPVTLVFDTWKAVMGHKDAKLTAGRARCIKARLKEGYSAADIIEAIMGCARSEFHMGKNEQKRRYDDITLICRNGEKVEGFIKIPRRESEAMHSSGMILKRGLKFDSTGALQQ